MNQLITISWRNIWRSKRRTLITISSIFFALFFAVIMRSFQLGTYNYFIDQAVESYSGYLQIQHPDYFTNPNINNSFYIDSSLLATIKNCNDITSFSARINAFALVSSGTKTKGILINAVDPEHENKFSAIDKRVIHFKLDSAALDSALTISSISGELQQKVKQFYGFSYNSMQRLIADLKLTTDEQKIIEPMLQQKAQVAGCMLLNNDDGVLVSERLARFLGVVPGDSLILMAQGYQGASANGLFCVRGLVKMPTIELDNKLIIMSKSNAELFLGMEGHVNVIALNIDKNANLLMIQNKLSNTLNSDKYSVKNWHQLNRALKQQIDGDNAGGIVFLIILYMIVFFGIFGTVLMMVMERRRQFAILISIGMSRFKLWLVLLFELLILGLIAIIIGLSATIPVIVLGIKYPLQLTGEMAIAMEDMGFDPIMPMAGFDAYFFNQAIIVFVMVIAVSVIPLLTIYRLKVNQALKA